MTEGLLLHDIFESMELLFALAVPHYSGIGQDESNSALPRYQRPDRLRGTGCRAIGMQDAILVGVDIGDEARAHHQHPGGHQQHGGQTVDDDHHAQQHCRVGLEAQVRQQHPHDDAGHQGDGGETDGHAGGGDRLDGGIGKNLVYGGSDDDTIFGNKGTDYLDGESGSDTYLLQFQGGAQPALTNVTDTGTGSGIDLFTERLRAATPAPEKIAGAR